MQGQMAAIILAAGQGSRMRSAKAKVLHKIAGLEMVRHAVRNVKAANFDHVYVVVGHQSDKVRAVLDDVISVEQTKQLGTGHAVDQCRAVLKEFTGPVLVTYGDTPLLQSHTIRSLLNHHVREQATATILTAYFDDPTGYGRILRGTEGNVLGIVEQKDADKSQQKIQEINTGTYCFDSVSLFRYLQRINADNAQGEYYLPDVLPLMIKDGHKVAGYQLQDAQESMGINDRIQLAEADKIMSRRICEYFMKQGVTIIDPDTTYIELDCTIGQDTVIYPQTFIQKGTIIGQDCLIGPGTRITASQVGDGAKVESCIVDRCQIEDGVQVAPYEYHKECQMKLEV